MCNLENSKFVHLSDENERHYDEPRHQCGPNERFHQARTVEQKDSGLNLILPFYVPLFSLGTLFVSPV